MKHAFKTAAAAVCLVMLALTGCTPAVQSTVTVFHSLPAKGSGETISIVAGNKAKAGTLEFRTYADKLARYFQAAGYTVIEGSDANPPRYMAVFNYGIDDGTLVTETYSVPQFGVTGYSSATTTGTISRFGGVGTLNATTNYTPTYGVTGSTTETSTTRVYKRAIVLNIFDLSKFRPDVKDSIRAAEVYDGKLSSSGSCGSMAGVMDPLLAAMFQSFPGESGKAQTVTIKAEGIKC